MGVVSMRDQKLRGHNRLLKVARVSVHEKFHDAECSRKIKKQKDKNKLSDDAENNTAISSADSKNALLPLTRSTYC